MAHGVAEMTPDLLPVQDLVARSLSRVEKAFDQALRSDLPPVHNLVRHVETFRGKMLRPALVVLCGLAAHPGSGGQAHADAQVSDAHITIAAVCELIHMATTG